MFPSRHGFLAAGVVLSLGLAACGGGNQAASSSGKGAIRIWYSNNADEVKWGTGVVAAWNQSHASEQVSGEQIPAGKSSEEVIGAAITAGTTPCLIFNTAPAAVPQFQKQGGLVSLSSFSDGNSFIEGRTGNGASQYKSTDGSYYQMPWKSNPVMIFYNKDLFKKAGLDSTNPPLKTYDQFLSTAQTLITKAVAKAAIWPAPTSEFYQPWFDFYPLFIAQTKGKQLVEKGEPQFNSADGLAVANFWKQLYTKGLAPKEAAQGDPFATGQAAMAIVGPWAIAVYGGKVNWGVAPVPTMDGMDPSSIHTFSDEKSIGMYASCKNRGTAWDFLKFSTSAAQDGQLLNLSGQMPLRQGLATQYAPYFAKNPEYSTFAAEAAHTVEVPNVANSIEIWQAFRDAWSKSVIFGKQDPNEALSGAAAKINQLVKQK